MNEMNVWDKCVAEAMLVSERWHRLMKRSGWSLSPGAAVASPEDQIGDGPQGRSAAEPEGPPCGTGDDLG